MLRKLRSNGDTFQAQRVMSAVNGTRVSGFHTSTATAGVALEPGYSLFRAF